MIFAQDKEIKDMEEKIRLYQLRQKEVYVFFQSQKSLKKLLIESEESALVAREDVVLASSLSI